MITKLHISLGPVPRVLIASNSIIADSTILESVPLGFSAINDVVFGSSNNMSYTNIRTSGLVNNTSIDNLMRERALAGYCVDAMKNIQILTEELSHLQETRGDSVPEFHQHQVETVSSLCRVWNWIARIESLEVSSVLDEQVSFESSGILNVLLGKNDDPISSYPVRMDTLGIVNFYSPER